MRPLSAPLLACIALTTVGCRAFLPSHLPPDGEWLVAVKSCRMSGRSAWYKGLAHHSWIDIRRGDTGRWLRIESAGRFLGVQLGEVSAGEARLDERFGGNTVRLLGWLDGAAAERAAPALEARARELMALYDDGYVLWPGPNSNTFVREVARAAPELGFVFDHNCVGKDYGGWIDVGLTASRTGVRVDTVPIGAALGLREGVELHLLGATLGVSLDPPGLSLPFLPQIPWGFVPGERVRLAAPDIPGAVRQRVEQALCDGVARELAVLGEEGTLVFEADDGSTWVRVDCRLGGPWTAESRHFAADVSYHSAEGVTHAGNSLLLDSTGAPPHIVVVCGGAFGRLSFTEQPGDRVLAEVRWFRSREAMAAARDEEAQGSSR